MEIPIGYMQMIFGGVARHPETQEELKASLNAFIEMLLKDSDFTQLNDLPMTSEERESWKNWRSVLREIHGRTVNAEVLSKSYLIPEPPTAKRPSIWITYETDTFLERMNIPK